MKEFVIKRCNSCGAVVEVLKDCNCPGCGIQCCGEEMKAFVPNSVDAAVEKHVPTYEKVGEKLVVTVNHVMEEEHYIEWVAMVTENKVEKISFTPGTEAKVEFPYTKEATLYAYCNKHGLWKKEVE